MHFNYVICVIYNNKGLTLISQYHFKTYNCFSKNTINIFLIKNKSHLILVLILYIYLLSCIKRDDTEDGWATDIGGKLGR